MKFPHNVVDDLTFIYTLCTESQRQHTTLVDIPFGSFITATAPYARTTTREEREGDLTVVTKSIEQ